MIKCKGNKVKVKGSAGEVIREAIILVKALDDNIPHFWDIVYEVCERAQAKAEGAGEEVATDDSDT